MAAGRMGDQSTHGGVVVGPGVSNVLIGGMPAINIAAIHTCALPPVSHQPTVSPFVSGSGSVMIGGLPAVRSSDTTGCGAMVAVGEPTVVIGG